MGAGERLKELRISKGFTLEELGQKVGVGKSTIRKWEQGMIANIKAAVFFMVTPSLFLSLFN